MLISYSELLDLLQGYLGHYRRGKIDLRDMRTNRDTDNITLERHLKHLLNSLKLVDEH